MINREARGLVFPVIMLVGIGLLMVYSSSVFLSMAKFGNSFHYFWRHLFNIIIGFTALFLLSKVDYHQLRILLWPLMIFSVLLLCMVFVPGIGMSAGAKSEVTRWINLRFFTFQPSELAKISMVIFLSDYMSRNAHRIKSFLHGVAVPLAVMAGFQGIILLQPDFGAVISIGILSVTLLFIGGIRLKYIFGIVGVSAPVIGILIYSASYRIARLTCFINPWQDSQGCGYQLVQSFLAFGRGGLTGVGVGGSKQKLFFLPEAHNDFIFSLIGEETGFIGVLFVLGIFLYLMIRLFKMARLIEDPFGYYLAVGLTLMITSQALINFAVTIGLMPTKGLPLPFISYGGSALLMNMAAFGILISISKSQGEAPLKRPPAISVRKQSTTNYNRRRYR